MSMSFRMADRLMGIPILERLVREERAAVASVNQLVFFNCTNTLEILDGTGKLIDKETVGPFLAILMALSNRTQQTGKVIDSFALRLGEEGKLWLNGKDVTALFMPSEAPSPR
jgi:hypothetical protein